MTHPLSPGKIFALIPKVAAEVGAIGKDRKNAQQGYSFRGIEDMYNEFHPALVKHGVFIATEVIDLQTSEFQTAKGGTGYRVLARIRHRFYAEDGSHVEVTTAGEGIDYADKASNKAMSAAMKYAFIQTFCIPTQDLADSDRETLESGPSRPYNPGPAPGQGRTIGNVSRPQGSGFGL